jgi:hypothetical protein
MRWVGRVAGIGANRNAYWVAMGMTEGKTHKEDLRVYGRIILKQVLEKKLR